MSFVPQLLAAPERREGESAPSSLKGLRVCFVAGTLGQGGAERQLSYILQALGDAGGRAKVLSLTQGEFWENPIREMGFEVAYVGRSPSRLKRLVAIGNECRRFRPMVVQSQHFYANGYAALTARLLGCREIGAIRNDVASEVGKVAWPMGRACLRWPRVLAPNSRAALRKLVSMGVPENRLFFLPNAISNSHPVSCSPARRGPFTILGVGRLVAQKRFDLFLQAVARVNARFPVRGIVAGDGPLRAELDEQARRLGLLPGRVEFVGCVDDIQSLFRQANLFLMASDHEGTPNAVLEAMAASVPVVGTRVGDMPDLLGDGSRGRLVAPGDVEGLASAVAELLGDPAARAGFASRALAYVQTEHSSAALRDHLTRLYSLALTK